MKRMIIPMLASMIAHTLCASPAATRSWVSNYVNTAVSTYTAKSFTTNINGVATDVYTAGIATLTVEKPSIPALMATNVVTAGVLAGITNGMYFVWNDPIHSYTNHAQIIEATPSNLVWNAIQSSGSVFSNYFGVVSRILQPSYAKEVTE